MMSQKTTLLIFLGSQRGPLESRPALALEAGEMTAQTGHTMRVTGGADCGVLPAIKHLTRM